MNRCCKGFLHRRRDAERGVVVSCPSCARAWVRARVAHIVGWQSWSDKRHGPETLIDDTRGPIASLIVLALWMVGCGNITPAASSDLVGYDGTDGASEVGVARDGGPPSETSGPDAPSHPDAGLSCIGGDADATGFAYNPGCDGGSTLPTSCHASCELNGAHFVGCAWDSRADGGYVVCHASCGECQ